MVKMTLGALRKNKGLSQSEVAKMMGCSVETISNHENGKTFPDVPDIEKYIKIYGMPYDGINFLPEDYDLTVNVI